MATPSQTPQPLSSLTLPDSLSPDSIDVLPVLSTILSRLAPLQPPRDPSLAASSPPAASPSQGASNGTGSLAPKDVPIATDGLKHKLQKARQQMKELPDVERTIAEQEEEIRELEDKIRRQKEVLKGLREVGLKAKNERRQEGEMEF